MEAFRINGPVTLKGEITPQGAKNEALQILAATLLTDDPVIVHNLPDILDIRRQVDLLAVAGAKIEWIGKNSLRVQADNIDLAFLENPEFHRLAASIRGSVLLLGPLLARFGRAIIAKPGGDKIGRRKLDAHLRGLEQLGAQFTYDEDHHLFRIKAKYLKGTYILLEEASVTGTGNVIMAATMAEGETTIYNAACEPYIQQLCRMLVSMGASIEGAGTNKVVVHGVKALRGCTHTCLPDMIEIGSFIGLAATTGSALTIRNAAPEHLGLIPLYFEKLGVEINVEGQDIYVPAKQEHIIESSIDGSIVTLADAPWPGFTPDLLSILLVTAIRGQGTVLIHQKMFESRLFFVDNLIDMGARIIFCDPHRVTVIGMGRKALLRGIKMRSPDIRAGVALLIAALSAEGVSTIYNIAQIDRGYEAIDQRLNLLGAGIERINANAE